MASRYKGGRTIYLTEPQIRIAMEHTRSNQSAASYLKVSFPTYRKYAKLFKNSKGVSLFDQHKNQSGRGMMKPRENARKFLLDDILMGKHPSYPKNKLFRRIIASNYMAEKCSHCGFHQKRATDMRMPVLLNHINGINTDHRLDNLEILCYNCFFITVGNLNSITLKSSEKEVKAQPDLNVTYAAAANEGVDIEEGTEGFGDVLSDEEKISMIKAIQGI